MEAGRGGSLRAAPLVLFCPRRTMPVVLPWIDCPDQRPFQRLALLRCCGDVERLIEWATVRSTLCNTLRHVEAGADIDNPALEQQQVHTNKRLERVRVLTIAPGHHTAPQGRWHDGGLFEGGSIGEHKLRAADWSW